MNEVYKKGNETKSISSLKAQYRDVILQLNERAAKAGYDDLRVELRCDKVAHQKYSFQGSGWEFVFNFYKNGIWSHFEAWQISAPAFKRGELSDRPIRMTIVEKGNNDCECRYEMI